MMILVCTGQGMCLSSHLTVSLSLIPDQDLCIAQGHTVDCILKPLHMYESASQQGFHSMG